MAVLGPPEGDCAPGPGKLVEAANLVLEEPSDAREGTVGLCWRESILACAESRDISREVAMEGVNVVMQESRIMQ